MKLLRPVFIVFAILAAGVLSQAQPADAAFHLMRIHAVMGGLNGDPNVQYVELRMCLGGQGFVAGHTLKFYDSAGTIKATFTFPDIGGPGVPEVTNASTGESILVATSEYNTASYGPAGGGAGGDADFVFAGANTVGSNGGDPLHPVQAPNGRVRFGDQEGEGCDAGGTLNPGDIDSVAYGTAPADFGTAAAALPSPSDTRALRLNALSPGPTNNSLNYAIAYTSPDAKNVALADLPSDLATPRNNARQVATFGILPGLDYWETEPGGGQDFATTPIPLNFFDPGSDPFTGIILMCSSPIDQLNLGTADTIIRRFDAMLLDGPPETVPIELVQLRLVSCNPITVTYPGPSESWSVAVDLSPGPVPPPAGQMTVTKAHPNGGTFSAQFNVLPRFTFTEVGNPGNVRILDFRNLGFPPGQYPPNQYQSVNTEWRHTCPTTGFTITSSSSPQWCAGVDATQRVLTTLQAPAAQQPILPACFDPDNDTVGSCVDNCPNTANLSQTNSDADTLGDACDNCPTTTNQDQANPDSDPYGTACETAPCVAIPNFWNTVTNDNDCDGFPDFAPNQSGRGYETFITTDPADQCADTTALNDESAPGVSPWPTDINDNKQTALSDVLTFISHFNTTLNGPNPPGKTYAVRWDLNASNSVTISDVLLYIPFFNKNCTT